MEWYKHQTCSHDDPDISDAWDELGDFGYAGFFVILEIYGQEYSHRNSDDFINISKTFLRRKLRKSWTKVELLLDFYSEKNRILSKSNNKRIEIKIPKFIDLASNWARRKPTEAPTEAPHAIEVDKEEDIKKKRLKRKHIKPSLIKEKILYGEACKLTQKEFYQLCDDFGQIIIKKYITKFDEYVLSREMKQPYIDHNRVLRKWLNGDGICKRKKERDKPESPDILKLEYNIKAYKKHLRKSNPELQKWFEDKVLKLINENVNDQSFNTWFKPLVAISAKDKILKLLAPQKYYVLWINEHYDGLFEKILAEIKEKESDQKKKNKIPETVIITCDIPEKF